MSSQAEHRRRSARRGLALYFALVVVGSGTLEGMMIARGKPIGEMVPLAVANMWVPGLASIVTRLVRREGFADVSFALRGRHGLREVLVAWLYPVPVGALAYGVAWATSLAKFRGGAGTFLVSLALALTLSTVLSALAAGGEELGWRGYMLTRLVDAGVPRPLLVSGLVWGSWHAPLIVSGQYASGPIPLLSALLFVAGILPESYAIARVRLASGSVWPAVLMHASWNAVIQGPFDAFTVGGSYSRTDSIWVGESGVLVVVASIVVAAALTLRPFAFRRAPSDEPARTLSLAVG